MNAAHTMKYLIFKEVYAMENLLSPQFKYRETIYAEKNGFPYLAGLAP